jgi:prepilin-type N-terminal cleavage/methylation domain
MNDRRGFTLIEIMIALAIVGIGLVIAISNLQLWIHQTNASGFKREMFTKIQEARTRTFSAGVRHRVVINLTNETTLLQTNPGGAWSATGIQVSTPTGSRIASVVPTPGGAVTTGTYALVFNPSGEVYGQTNIANDNTIAPIDNAVIRLTGVNPQDNASITVFGWTGKARLN